MAVVTCTDAAAAKSARAIARIVSKVWKMHPTWCDYIIFLKGSLPSVDHGAVTKCCEHWEAREFLELPVFAPYDSVERVALAFGLFELAFIVVAWRSALQVSQVASQFFALPLRDPQYLYLAAANIGAVIMPWMVLINSRSRSTKAWDFRT